MDISRAYQIRPLAPTFGVECLGVDLGNLVDDDTSSRIIRQIKNDLVEHRALLFRKQNLSGQRQVDISNQLGKIESTFYKHPKSPHPDIFRVSNDDAEGCTSVGRSGWHIDGTFQLRPFMYQTMYFPSVAKGGDTYFVPLKELYDSFSTEDKEYYDKLWMVTGKRQAPIHPLVGTHPFRPNNETTMTFHCGLPFVKGWYEDKDAKEVNTDRMIPAGDVQRKLTNSIEAVLDNIGLRMQWEAGDFLLTDNLGLAHYASEGTQEDAKVVGLRVLHRTTIVGGPETVPRKEDGRKSFTVAP